MGLLPFGSAKQSSWAYHRIRPQASGMKLGHTVAMEVFSRVAVIILLRGMAKFYLAVTKASLHQYL